MQKSEDGDTLATSQLKEGMIAKLIVIPWLHIQIFTYHVVPSVYSGGGGGGYYETYWCCWSNGVLETV